MIYRFRVILDNDTEDDIFRDIEIRETDSLEDLHNAITQSFGFDGLEMASFYVSNEDWDQGEEISMFDVSEGHNDVRTMSETVLNTVVDNTQTKALPESAIFKEGDSYYVFSVEKENNDWSFKPIEVVLGTKDGDWVSVQFTKDIESNTQFAYNNAYYPNAEMKKGEAEHAH